MGLELTLQSQDHAHLGTTATWHSSFGKMTGKGWFVRCVTMESPSEEISVGHADGLYRLWEWAPPTNICPCFHVVHAPLRDVILASFTEMPHHISSFKSNWRLPDTAQTSAVWTAEMVLGLARLSWIPQVMWELPQQTAVFQVISWKGNKTLPFPILATKQKT